MGAFRVLGELLGGSRKPLLSQIGLQNGYYAAAPVPTTVPSERRLQLLEKVVAHNLESYKENTRIITQMDEKAQRCIAFGGFSIAAVLAFTAKARGYDLLGTVGYSGLTILSAAILAFLASGIAGIAELWVRFIEGMLSPSALGRITEDLLDAALETESVQVSIENWYRTQSTTWTGIIASQAKAMMRKSRWLLRAQKMLLTGLILISGFLLMAVTNTNLDLLPVWFRPLLPR